MKTINYLCPGCLYLGKNNIAQLNYNILKCDVCFNLLKTDLSSKEINLFKTFSKHNKQGYNCPDCNRFVPRPLYTSTVSCPYFDCCFVGDISSLKRMNHPTIQSNINSSISKKENPIKDNQVNIILEIIRNQKNMISYRSFNFNSIHKTLIYDAFSNLLTKYSDKMIDYLLYQSRTGGFQHKVFQEYVSLLENEFPYCYRKGGKIYRINSLLDPNLNLFDGISTFDAIVTDNLEIKNNTKEFYIGGRKASYAKPYYIGKLLSIQNKEKESLIDCVKEYSFSKIKMKNITPGIEVTVTHLRVCPHYQMAGMTNLNRIRKKIVDESKTILESFSDGR